MKARQILEALQRLPDHVLDCDAVALKPASDHSKVVVIDRFRVNSIEMMDARGSRVVAIQIEKE